MKLFVLFCLLVFLVNTMFSQISSGSREFFYRQLSCNPQPILDKVSTTNLSFGYSFRKLREGYTGNCMRIRRASDNVEADIPFTCLNFVDTNYIKSFLNGSIGFVTTWYDQSGLNRNAVNTNTAQQPQFNLNASNNKLGIVFDGSDDYLRLNTSMLLLTNNGLEGSLFMVFKATTSPQYNFGVVDGYDRWSVHANWTDNYFYFDAGYCCNTVRSFNNIAGIADFYQYSILRGSNYVTINREGTLGYNTTYSPTPSILNFGPSLGAGSISPTTVSGFSNSMYQEIIMFKIDITGTDFAILEADQMNFW